MAVVYRTLYWTFGQSCDLSADTETHGPVDVALVEQGP